METIPVDDAPVRALLRSIGEPITLFGEDNHDRRMRLKQLCATLGTHAPQHNKDDHATKKHEDDDTPTFYEWCEELLKARLYIANYSIKKASMRCENQRRERQNTPTTVANFKLQELYKTKRSVTLLGSQVADTRLLSNCHFSPNGKVLATSSWSGICKLWSIPNCTQISELSGHKQEALCVRFHPQSTLTQEESACNIATSGNEGSINLWSLNSDVPIKTWSDDHFQGSKVPRLAFHPSGRFLGATCYDKSWRLFDLEADLEVLHQEGHNEAVFDIGFHPDGSLAVTGSLDGSGIAWDLRTGHCLMKLEGHVKSVIAVDISPDGYHLATGSEDNSVKIWDLRQRKVIYTITGHNAKVSKVKFQPTNGQYLLTSSHDKTAKLWAYPNWVQIQTLSGHGDFIMSSDITQDDQYIATCSREKTFMLWSESF